ncbi:MAG TPA: hypothetical protein VIX17_02220 [Pyrinomonadaceae bacterium]|jgi:hypothetical protein
MGVTREKFGLSWLNKSQPEDAETKSTQPSRSSQQVDAALVGVGVKVVSKLNSAPNRTAGFNELAGQTGVPINQLIPVINYLAELRWVQYIDDDKIQLTDEGTAEVS